jgi:hypothetical protein
MVRVENTAPHCCSSIFAVGTCFFCEAVTQQRLPNICLYRGRFLAAEVVYRVIT